MNHPEPPPDCSLFDKYNDGMGWRFNWSSFEFSWLDQIDPERPRSRRIIAAVAEVEWRKISEKYKDDYWRIFNKYMTDVGLSPKEQFDMHNSEKLMRSTEKTAIEWRTWGEDK